MKIYDLKMLTKDDEVEVSVSIESEELGQKRLWFSTLKKFENCLCKTRIDGFLVGLLFPAMQYGENIHVVGCVSEKLLFNLNNYVVPLLMAFSPSSKRIEITADDTSSERFDCKGVGTGFSGGVDSFCTIYDRLELENSPDYKINSFLFLNVGSHGMGESEEKLAIVRGKFRKTYEYLKRFPDELNLNFIPLDSNLHAFHPWGHQKAHTLTSVAGILMFQVHFVKYYYASSGLDYSEIFANSDRYRDIDVGAYCDPVLLPLLSTESLDLIADGSQYTRTEKMLHIVTYKPVKTYLNVCVNGEDSYKNCAVCSKCSRTLMTLDSLGVLDQFSSLFDIDKYMKIASKRYACQQVLLRDKDPFARGNLELAEKNGVRLPSRAEAEIYALREVVIRFSIKLLKRVLPVRVVGLIKEKRKRE